MVAPQFAKDNSGEHGSRLFSLTDAKTEAISTPYRALSGQSWLALARLFPNKLLCAAPQRRRMRRFQEALFVRPQIPAARIPGFRLRKEKRIRQGLRQVRSQERKHLRTAPHPDARHAHRLPLRRMRRAPAEPLRDSGTMPKMRIRSSCLQTMRTLRSLEPLRMQSARPRARLSERQTQRLPVL